MNEHASPRTWMITGTSSGFGWALAHAVVAAGDRVVATARRREPLEALIREAPDRAIDVPLDVTDPEQITAAVAAAVDRFGRVDVLVNNAGYGSVGALEEIDIDELNTLHDTMFIGPLRLTQAVLPAMRERGGGTIVQISSMGGQLAPPGFGAYCAAKFALEAISESLAAEVGPLGIRVLIIEPGAFRTAFGASRMHRSRSVIDDYTPTVGSTRAAVDEMDGTQPGDPRLAAAAILEVVNATSASLRLALGDDAVDNIRAKHERLRSDLQQWEQLSRSTTLANKMEPKVLTDPQQIPQAPASRCHSGPGT
jgi:NAD(P)-dependent dehydrogenase (short-subunit alcohol dehydrogenase family)